MKNRPLRDTIEFATVRDLIEWAGTQYSNKTAYSYKEGRDRKSVTFRTLRDDVRALTTKRCEMGVAGKSCVLVGKLSYEWTLTYFSVMAAGGVLVPLDRDWQAKDLSETAKSADAAFLFCDSDLSEAASEIENAVSLEAPTAYLASAGECSLSSLIEEGREMYKGSKEVYFNAPEEPLRMSLLVFTSGTTGKGKGVMLSQHAILSDMYDIIPYIDFADKTVGVLPPHHTSGSTIMLIGHTMIGCEVYISSGIRYVQKELKAEKPGHLVLVPLYLETFYRKIQANIKDQGKEKLVRAMIKMSNGLRKLGIDRRRQLFSSILEAFGTNVRMVITGGAPINEEIVHFFEAIGIEVLNGYGITECAPLISVNRSGQVVDQSVGAPIDMDTVIIDEPNEDGEGEILVKGPNVMLGYYKDDEATRAAFKDGYFRTGDYGKLSEDGILFITGRKKNLIILSNGKNVYPEEIENELISVPGILDIIVYEGQSKRGISHNAIVCEIYPDKDWFEANGIEDKKAYFEPFVEEYNKSCVPYKKIAHIKIRNKEFPKNTLRKIMRFKLDTTID